MLPPEEVAMSPARPASVRWFPPILAILALPLASCSSAGGSAGSPDASFEAEAGDAGDVPGDLDRDPGGDPGGPVRPSLYRVEDRRLREASGAEVFLRGINVASWDLVRWRESDPEVEATVFRHIAQGGFGAIRLVINWDRIEPEPDRYDAEALDLVERHVRLATAAGLKVMIDMHQDLYGVGFGLHGAPRWTCDEQWYAAFTPVEPWGLNYFSEPIRACFGQFWRSRELRSHLCRAARQVAERVADVEEVLGFDPINEPVPGDIPFEVFDRDFLQDFYAQFAEEVLPALPGRVLFIEPALTFSMRWQNDMVPPLPFPAVFVPHFYDLSVENLLWDASVATLEEAVRQGDQAAEDLGIPLAYGEMGGARETPNLGEYLEAFYGLLDRHLAGAFQWIYSRGTKGFGMIDSGTMDWNEHAWAFLRPAPFRVFGILERFSWEPRAGRFEMTWQDDGAGSTEVLVPTWIQAAGFRCLLDGREQDGTSWYDPERGRLVLPAGGPGPRSLRLELTTAARPGRPPWQGQADAP